MLKKKLFQIISRFTIPMKYLNAIFPIISLTIYYSFFFNTSIYFFLIINKAQSCKSIHNLFFHTTLIIFSNMPNIVKVPYIAVRVEYYILIQVKLTLIPLKQFSLLNCN
jgi:hypothetical protein